MNPFVPRLSRRETFRVGAVSVGSYLLSPTRTPDKVQAAANVEPRGSAEICIFILLKGGPSQLETFDLKEGPWTPDDWGVATVSSGFRMPVGVLPKLAKRHDKYAIIRSMEAWESEHSRGVYYIQAGRIFSPARAQEIPSVGSIIAYETINRRHDNDFLPPFLSLDMTTTEVVGGGCLNGQVDPLVLQSNGKLPFVVPDNERKVFERRRQFLENIDSDRQNAAGSRGRIFAEIDQQYELAYPLLSNSQATTVFQLKDEDRQRYGKSSIGDSCQLARNVVEAHAGTRFILITNDGWDLHDNAFDKTANNNQYVLCQNLDNALSALLDDLEIRTDENGCPLINKTVIACMGEFGRTPGELTLRKGRDHYRFAAVGLFAGAGVQGGQIIGATDETAAKVVDPGWHAGRPIYPEDVLATIYSTMGVDWSKKITKTSSGRPFEYIENISPQGRLEFDEVRELFG